MVDVYRAFFPDATVTVFPKKHFYPLELTAEQWNTRFEVCATSGSCREPVLVRPSRGPY